MLKRSLEKVLKKFTMIFADPPYQSTGIDSLISEKLKEIIANLKKISINDVDLNHDDDFIKKYKRIFIRLYFVFVFEF